MNFIWSHSSQQTANINHQTHREFTNSSFVGPGLPFGCYASPRQNKGTPPWTWQSEDQVRYLLLLPEEFRPFSPTIHANNFLSPQSRTIFHATRSPKHGESQSRLEHTPADRTPTQNHKIRQREQGTAVRQPRRHLKTAKREAQGADIPYSGQRASF